MRRRLVYRVPATGSSKMMEERGGENPATKFLNNSVEQDLREIKRVTRPTLGFKSFHSTTATHAGVELMHMIRQAQLQTTGKPSGGSVLRSRGITSRTHARLVLMQNARHDCIARPPSDKQRERPFLSRWAVNKKSMVCPCLSTAW